MKKEKNALIHANDEQSIKNVTLSSQKADEEMLKLYKLKFPIIESEINEQAVDIISETIPEIMQKTNAFGRQASQHTLGLMSLTMLNGNSSPIRLLRQISVEIQARVDAARAGQVSLMEMKKNVAHLMERDVSEGLDEHEMNALVAQTTSKHELVGSLNGTLKDLASLCNYYERIKKTHNIDDEWDEVTFEKAEKKHHVRRCFEMLYRNLISQKSAGESVLEYMSQHGLHPQVAIREVGAFVNFQEQKINKDDVPDGTELEDWLDSMAEKYEDCPGQVAKRMFGTEEFLNYDIMNKKLPKPTKV